MQRMHTLARALSIRPPWAWAIAQAGKRIENRTWTTPYRGLLYIHASASAPASDSDAIERLCGRRPPATMTRGAIIASAQLVAIRPVADVVDRWAFGPWCWVLDDVRAIEPRPMKGRLGLWTPEEHTATSTSAAP
jgi:hypothetical protein